MHQLTNDQHVQDNIGDDTMMNIRVETIGETFRGTVVTRVEIHGAWCR